MKAIQKGVDKVTVANEKEMKDEIVLKAGVPGGVDLSKAI